MVFLLVCYSFLAATVTLSIFPYLGRLSRRLFSLVLLFIYLLVIYIL